MKNFRSKLVFFIASTIFVLLASQTFGMELDKGKVKWSASLEIGSTFDGSPSYRVVGAYWFPQYLRLWKYGTGHLRLELDTGFLDNTDATFDIGFQPVFRYECHRFHTITPYLDLGAGVHFLSRANINGRQLGAAQQFSLIAALGLSFKNGIELGYRYMHLSNADTHDNNDGRDEHLGVITFLF